MCDVSPLYPLLAQGIASNPAHLQQLAATLRVSADDARSELTAHFDALTRQQELLVRNQDRGCSRLIANLAARTLWREYCGATVEEVPQRACALLVGCFIDGLFACFIASQLHATAAITYKAHTYIHMYTYAYNTDAHTQTHTDIFTHIYTHIYNYPLRPRL